MFLGWTAGGAIRWRMPVIGVPTSAKFVAPSVVLIATTQGQVLLLNHFRRHFRRPRSPLARRRRSRQRDGRLRRLCDERPALRHPRPRRRGCEHLAHVPQLLAAGCHRLPGPSPDYGVVDGKREVREAWHATSPAVSSAPPRCPPTVRRCTPSAVSASSSPCGRRPGRRSGPTTTATPSFATLTATPDGHIIPTGPLCGPVTMLADRGDRAEKVWSRTDLKTASLGALTNSGTAWTVVRTEDDGLALIEVSAADGKTLRTLPLPEAKGPRRVWPSHRKTRSPLPPTSAGFASSTRRNRSGTSPAVASPDLAGLAPPQFVDEGDTRAPIRVMTRTTARHPLRRRRLRSPRPGIHVDAALVSPGSRSRGQRCAFAQRLLLHRNLLSGTANPRTPGGTASPVSRRSWGPSATGRRAAQWRTRPAHARSPSGSMIQDPGRRPPHRRTRRR